MPVTVIDEIVPKNNGLFPIVRDTNTLGGWRTVADMTARNNIPTQRRSVGMRCYVVSADKLYALIGGTANSNWMEVTEGSITIASGRVDCTTSAINMTVDPVNGVSPVPGTITHNQTEYNALGAPLKYAQDALDILPIGIGHPIIVSCLDGMMLNKPNAVGAGYTAGFVTKFHISTASKMYDDSTPYFMASLIVFKGVNKTVLYSGSGTAAGRGAIGGITPGGMTLDQYNGKLLIFTSGANAGFVMPIRTNGVDYINGPPSSTSAGACTFYIFEPSAVLMDSEDGINPSSPGFGCRLLSSSSVQYYFDNIRFGTDTLPYTAMLMQTPAEAYPRIIGCMFDFGYPYETFYFAPGSNVYIFSCSMNLHNAGSFIIPIGAQPYIMDCYIYGTTYNNGPFFDIEGGYLYIGNCMIRTDVAFTGSVFSLIGGHIDHVGENWLWNTLNSAGTDSSFIAYSLMDLSAGMSFGPSSIGGYYCYVGSARAIIYARNCPAASVYYTYAFIHIGADNAHIWEMNYANIRTTGFVNGDGTGGTVSDIRLDGLDYSFNQFKQMGLYLYEGMELIGQYGSHLIYSAG